MNSAAYGVVAAGAAPQSPRPLASQTKKPLDQAAEADTTPSGKRAEGAEANAAQRLSRIASAASHQYS